MRELKFRGKATDRAGDIVGKWLLSTDFDANNPNQSITEFFRAISNGLIDPETVGQWTGLKDSKGVDVYEGDLLRQIENGENIGDFEVEWERTYGFYCKSIGDEGDPEYNAEMINIEQCEVCATINDKAAV